MNNNAVNVAIGADSSAFQRGMQEVKAIARAAAANIQQTMTSIKVPVPDLGRVLEANKKQVFNANAAILTDTKQTVAKLKVLLDQQAADYRAAHQRSMADARRIQHSGTKMPAMPAAAGQWDHLEGTQFAGGPQRRGIGAKGNKWGASAYGLGVAWNAGQDLAQGGLGAVANNVPQIINLVTNSPALKGALAAGGAAAAAVLSTVLAGWSYYKNVYQTTGAGFDDIVDKRQGDAKAEAARKKLLRDRQTASGTSARQAGIAADNQAGAGDLADGSIEAMRRSAGLLAERREAAAKVRRAELEAIEDPAARAKALAEDEKAQLKSKLILQGEVAARAFEIARAEEAAAEARMKTLRADIAGLTKASPTPDDLNRRAALQTEMPAVQSRLDDARARSSAAGREVDTVNARAALLPMENKLIDMGRDRELGRIQKETSDKNVAEAERLSSQESEGRLAYAEAVEKWKNLWREASEKAEAARKEMQEKNAATKKQKEAMEEQLEISELQAGGGSRKAKKLERARELRENTEKYKGAGFTEPQAAAMARREQGVNDRRENPRSIRGAGFGGPDPDRVTGLDYFEGTDEERKMKKAETRNLLVPRREGSKFGDPSRKTLGMDERRGIPGVGGQVDKGFADREAAEAKKASAAAKTEESPRLAALLQKILQVLESKGSPAAGIPSN